MAAGGRGWVEQSLQGWMEGESGWEAAAAAAAPPSPAAPSAPGALISGPGGSSLLSLRLPGSSAYISVLHQPLEQLFINAAGGLHV